MPITNWYLKLERLPVLSEETQTYLEGLKPFQAAHWDQSNDEMKAYKASIIQQLIEIQENRCAYCGLSLNWNLIDREHFVHKGQRTGFPEFMFNVKNLFAACGYCNRRIKGQKHTLKTYNANYDDCTFRIVHPFIDTAEDELEFVGNRNGQHILAKAITDKGQKTIDFFCLSDNRVTVRRAGFIAERELEKEMQADDYAELKAISYYKPD